MNLILSLLAAAIIWAPGQQTALAFSRPSSSVAVKAAGHRHCGYDCAVLFATSSCNNHESITDTRIGVQDRLPTTSLFPKRTSERKFIQTIPTLLFVMLRKVIFGARPAFAATKFAHLPTPAMISLQKLLSNIFTALRHPTKETLKKIALGLATIYFAIQLLEGLAASKRQQSDPTSEWGRYADKPQARGMALSLLMIKLTPYAILPLLHFTLHNEMYLVELATMVPV